MKNKLSKWGFLLMAFVFLLHSCRQDFMDEPTQKYNPDKAKFKAVNLKDIPHVTAYVKSKTGRKDLKISVNNRTNKSLARNSQENFANLEESFILKKTENNISYYVFNVNNYGDDYTIYNVEAKEINGQVVDIKIVEYNSQKKYGTSPLTILSNFTGRVISYDIQSNIIDVVDYIGGEGACPPTNNPPYNPPNEQNPPGGGGGGYVPPVDNPPYTPPYTPPFQPPSSNPPTGGGGGGGGGSPVNENLAPAQGCWSVVTAGEVFENPENPSRTVGWYNECTDEFIPNFAYISYRVSNQLSSPCGEGSGVVLLPFNPNSNNPCEKTKEMLQTEGVPAKLDALYAQSKLKGEKAFMMKNDGTPSAIIPGGEHSADLGNMAGHKGAYHNHTPGGVKIFSPTDIHRLFDFISLQPAGTPITDGFMGVIASRPCAVASACPPDGYEYINYVIRYNGTYDEAKAIYDKYKEPFNFDVLRDKYKKFEIELRNASGYSSQNGNFMSLKGLEEVFFNALDEMGIDKSKIILQRIDRNENITNVTLDENGKPKDVACP